MTRLIPLALLLLTGCPKDDPGDTGTPSTSPGTPGGTPGGTPSGTTNGGTPGGTPGGTTTGNTTTPPAGPLGWATLDGDAYMLDMPPFGAACGEFGDKYTISTSADGPDTAAFAMGSIALHLGTNTPTVGSYETVVDWVGGSTTQTGFLFQDDAFGFWTAQDGAGNVEVTATAPVAVTWTDLPVQHDDGTVVLSSGAITCP